MLHPPGYPLWCLLARGWAEILPLGDFAWRVNLFSGLCAALGCAVGRRLLRRLGVGRAAALAGACLAGLGDAVWASGVVAEVYGATLLSLLAALLALERWRESPAPGRFGAFLLVSGLSLCLQPLSRGLVPMFLLFALLDRPRSLLRGKTLVAGAGGLLLGLLPVLYLPIRSAADPLLDWGDPETPRALWDHLAMRQYSHAEELGMDPPTFLGFGPRMEAFGRALRGQFPWPLLAVAAAGAAILVARARRSGLVVLATALATSVGAVWATSRRDAFFFPPAYGNYCVPAFALLGLFVGAGIEGIARGRWRKALLPFLASAAVAWTAAANGPRNDRSRDAFFEPFGRALLAGVEPGGVLIAVGDHLVFPCLFLEEVRGHRRDVLLGQRYGYFAESDLSPLSEEERRARAALRGAPRLEFDEAMAVRKWLGSRPVYVAGTRAPDHYRRFRGLEGTLALPEGLLVRVYAAGEASPEVGPAKSERTWRRLSLPPLKDASSDVAVRLSVAMIRLTRGMHRAAVGDLGGARGDLRALLGIAEADPASLYNAAAALAAAGDGPGAIPFLHEAVRKAPGFEAARALLARLEGRGR